MSIKIPKNYRPLATIMEGGWYFVGKNGRPTLELTKTKRRRIQRQYYTFLKNEDNTQVFADINSTRIENDLEGDLQAEQTVYQPKDQSEFFPADDQEN
ncbi:unnamed protein product [Prunus armeniaca]